MKILIASSIHKSAIEKLQKEHDVVCSFNASEESLISAIADREILIFRSGVKISTDVLKSAPNLKLLLRAGSGLDNLDLNYVNERNIKLVRIPQPGAKAVAELSFAFMLALSRDLFKADSSWRNGHWVKSEMNGYLLTDKVLGVVGCGNIGSRVGAMGAAWGMNVLGCVRHSNLTNEFISGMKAKGIKITSFNEVVENADYLSIHVPLDDSTRNLIDQKVLNKMKTGSYLMNLARGGVVNEQDLYHALTEGGKLRGAATDVHVAEGEGKISPLAELKNVILTPHIGAQTIDSQKEIGEIILSTVEEFEKEKIKVLQESTVI
jgi:phosphoglycerate dehydrogenase-like enzyme